MQTNRFATACRRLLVVSILSACAQAVEFPEPDDDNPFGGFGGWQSYVDGVDAAVPQGFVGGGGTFVIGGGASGNSTAGFVGVAGAPQIAPPGTSLAGAPGIGGSGSGGSFGSGGSVSSGGSGAGGVSSVAWHNGCADGLLYPFDQNDGNDGDEFVHGFYTDAYSSLQVADFVYDSSGLFYASIDGDPFAGSVEMSAAYSNNGQFVSITDGFFDLSVARYGFSASVKLVDNPSACSLEAAVYTTDGSFTPTRYQPVPLVQGQWVQVEFQSDTPIGITMIGLDVRVGSAGCSAAGAGWAVLRVDSIDRFTISSACGGDAGIDGGL